MTEEAILVLISLAIVIGFGVLAFNLARKLLAQYPSRWIVRMPIYFGAYHIAWAFAAIILGPSLGQAIIIVNPIYALALHNQRAFERLFAAILPRFGSGLLNFIALLIGIVVVSTSLWIFVGVGIGGVIDLGNRKRKAL